MKSSRPSIPDSVNLPSSGKLLLAFSGGEDSLFLMYVLSVLAPQRTEAVYVNHGLRSEEELSLEMKRNRRNASSLGIPLTVLTVERGEIERRAKSGNIGVEAAAREVRYSLLENYAFSHGLRWILTAHHEDDQAETVLMRMLSHSPFWAWGGVRKTSGRIFRPILHVPKDEIHSTVVSLGLDPSVDSTNSDTRYRRNWIRHNIMPLISPEAKRLLSSIAENAAGIPQERMEFSSSSPVFVSFEREKYLSCLPPVREKTLYSAFSVLGEKERLSRRYLSGIDSMIERGEKRVETKAYIIYVTQSLVKCYSKRIPSFSVPYNGEETEMPYPLSVEEGGGDSLSLSIDEEFLSSCVVRLAGEGDTIDLVDGKRRISSLLKEWKVPYAVILERDGRTAAFFSSFLGGRDRIALFLRERRGRTVRITAGGGNESFTED